MNIFATDNAGRLAAARQIVRYHSLTQLDAIAAQADPEVAPIIRALVAKHGGTPKETSKNG